MPYRVAHTGVSAPAFPDDENAPSAPWLQGQIIDDKYVDAHPFKAKLLRVGGVVKVSEQEATRDLAADNQAQVADLQAQIAALQAQLQVVQGQAPEPHAPAQVRYDLDPNEQPQGAEAERNRAAGKEVVQPTSGDVVVGEVVPSEAAEDTKPRSRERK
jgi:hypothetical protein